MSRSSTVSAPRERLSFNSGWRFQRGDAPDANGALGYAALRPWLLATGVELMSEGLAKPQRPLGNPGDGVSFTRPDFDDSAWRALTLPHDFGIEGPFAQELPGETGKLPWQGTAWYRKRFELSQGDSGRRIALEVDGAMAFSSFWLNGHFIGGWPYGYTSFTLDLTPFLRVGGENVLAVRLENPEMSSRWYPGSGLYRNLWLTETSPVRVAHWGTFVSTPRITPRAAIVNVDVTLENLSSAELELTLITTLHELDEKGHSRAEASASSEFVVLTLPAGQQALRTQCIELEKPKLWQLKRPRRYVAITELHAGDRLLDRVETSFGVRSVEVDPDVGLLLNGERVPLNGVCMHHDLGALGSALNTRALERQLEILQEMGCNAIRTSHNPPAPELLELCDRRGLLVMVEAFDCWRRGKKQPEGLKEGDPGFRYFDYGSVFDDWHERDLRAMLRRDRNHPSVVMWSIGNEVLEQWYPDGWKLSTRLAGLVREEDRTRPITSGFNGEIAGYSGFQTAVDVVGYNYKPWAYEKLHRDNPTIAIVGSETSSCISTRGEYFFPVTDDIGQGQVNFQVSSYDLSAPPWALPPDREFAGLDAAPYVAGEFVWTGFDYLGEPTPYNSDATNLLNFSDPEAKAKMAAELERLGRLPVPSRSSYFGIVDLAGFPKDRFYLYQARWRPELQMAHILPHWTWPERVGEVTPVHVYSSGDEAELFLNKKSLGKRKRKPGAYRFRWDDVLYEPGKLQVVVRKQGKKWATATRRTAGAAAKLVLSADRAKLSADGNDLSFITVTVADERGELVPRSSPLIRFSLEGPAVLTAVDNGDPTSFEPFQASERHAFNGLALCVVRTQAGKPGAIRVRAEAGGLVGAEISLSSRAR
jgi:beta-galactosidase